jgi:hypothetical protein
MSNSNLPAELTSMATGLAASVSTAGENSGGVDLFAKMGRDGVFVYGADNTEFEPGSLWALNPLGIYHGLIAWGDKAHGTDGQNLGEVLVPASQPLPQESDMQEVKGTWSKIIALQLRCISGEDEGTQILFKSNSYGGRKAYSVLVAEVVGRITAGEEAVVPVIEFTSESYKHASYGKIYNPVFNIRSWTTMAGDAESAKIEEAPEEAPAEEPPVEEKPRRRQRAKA